MKKEKLSAVLTLICKEKNEEKYKKRGFEWGISKEKSSKVFASFDKICEVFFIHLKDFS